MNNAPDSRSPFRKALFAALSLAVIAAAVVAAFSGSLSNGFTNWDDDDQVVNNALIREISPGSLAAMWKEGLAGYQGPLALLSLALDYRIGGPDPRVFHATALILHVLICWTLFLLLRRLGLTGLEALLATLLFGLHPLRVESVAWAAERKDLLCALFFFGAMYFYQGRRDARPRLGYALCLASFVLALASKPMAVTLPFVLLLQDYVSRRPWSRAVLVEKIPFLLLAGAAAIPAWLAQKGAMPVPGTADPFSNVLIAVRGAAFYLGKTVWPAGLSAFYPYPRAIGPGEPQFLAALIALVLLGTAAALLARRSRRPAFAALFFAVTLLPVLKIVPIGNAAAADRYTLIPSLGLVFLAGSLAGGCVRLLRARASGAFAAVFLALLGAACAVLGIAAAERCKVWRDSETLWKDVIAGHPDAALAHYNLGLALRSRGDYHGALAHYRRAIALEPRHAEAHNNIAFVLRLEGDALKRGGDIAGAQGLYAEAEAGCRTALRLAPTMWEAHLNLSFVLGAAGRYGEALDSARRALELNPRSPDAWYTRGLSLFHLRRFEEARPSLERAAELDPGLAEAVAEVKARMEL